MELRLPGLQIWLQRGILMCLLFVIVQQVIFYFEAPISFASAATEIYFDDEELIICYGLIFHNIFNYWHFGREGEVN